MGVTKDNDNFKLLRLLFASLVIISHAPESLYGNDDHELLYRFSHNLKLGQLAVAGFFLISGYLITSSYFNSHSVWFYLRKRVLRIYPGFLVASLICLFVMAPIRFHLAPGAAFSQSGRFLLDMATLTPPGGRIGLGAPDQPWAFLDGPMWTIGFEFRCYLLVALFGVTGLLRYRYVILGLAVLLILTRTTILYFQQPLLLDPSAVVLRALIISPSQMLDLSIPFLAGICFKLFETEIVFKGSLALICALALAACAKTLDLNAFALTVFWGYVVFWLARGWRWPVLGTFDKWPDISYGVYLYASPIAGLVLLYWPHLTQVELIAVNIPLAGAAGLISWYLIEKPAMDMGRRRHRVALAQAVSQ